LPVEVLIVGSVAAPSPEISLRGLLLPLRQTELAFRRGGRIAELSVQEGDAVVAGQILGTLDRSDIEALRAQTIAERAAAQALLDELIAGPRKEVVEAARADVARLREQQALSDLTLERQRRLIAQNAGSQQTLDESIHQTAMSAAELAAAVARLSELEAGTRPEQIAAQQAVVERLSARLKGIDVDLQDAQLVAPFAGRIGRRFLDEGTTVGSSVSVYRLQEDHVLEARFGLPVPSAHRLQPGDQVRLLVDDQPMHGRVARLEPELDLQTRTRGVFVALSPEDSQRLLAGQIATLLLAPEPLPEDAAPGYWVPTAALQRGNRGLWSVLAAVESPGGWISERREVRVLSSEGDLSLVAGMLQPGDKIIASGLHRVAIGGPLTIVKSLTERTRDAALPL
jgi:RND family efflux transporter MFP subunit